MLVNLLIPPNRFLEDETRNCPLGILYVAAILERVEIPVIVTDLRVQDTIPEADVYGITCSSCEFEFARQIRERLKGRVILGGPQSLATQECLDEGFDVLIGEGETGLPLLLMGRHRLVKSPQVRDLDCLPFPARHLVKDVVSTTLCHAGKKATTIIASRGCPYACTYCASPALWGRKVRRHSPEYAMREIDSLVADYGIEELRFQDDEMNLDRGWLERFRSLVPYRCNARAECGNWDALKASGCYEVGIGVESCDPQTHQLAKRTQIERTRKGIEDAIAAGLDVRLFFIVGLPGDTHPAQRTMEWLDGLNLVGCHLNVFSPIPGSEMGENPERYGIHSNAPVGTILAQQGKPVWTWDAPETLTEEYETLRGYLRERRWILN